MRNAYCTGEAGKEAAKSSAKLMQEATSKSSKSLLETHAVKTAKEILAGGSASSAATDKRKGRGERLGEGDVTIDEDKLKKALEIEEARRMWQEDPDPNEKSKGKRKYNSLEASNDITEEQLEAYRMKRQNFDDPMANYKDQDTK
jgi:pre-mRNA-processing factor SLU7